jgi:hypothetical protein
MRVQFTVRRDRLLQYSKYQYLTKTIELSPLQPQGHCSSLYRQQLFSAAGNPI